jgi:aldose sugar dehydrogenase
MIPTMTSIWTRLAWYIPAAVLLLLLPVFRFSDWWWHLIREQKVAIVIVVAAFTFACAATLFFEKESSWRAVVRAFVRTFAALSVFLIVASLLRYELPRYLLIGLLCAALVIPASASPLSRSRIPPIVLALLAIVAAAMVIPRLGNHQTQRQTTKASFLKSAFYTLQATSRQGWVPTPATRGGGLDHLGDRVLLSTGDGGLYLLDVPQDDGPMKVETLATRVPNNREEFAKAFGGSSRQPTRSSEFREAGPPRVQTWRFRVADVIAREQQDRVQLFASHHNFNAADNCFDVQVSKLDMPRADFPARIAEAKWQTLYEATPCIPLSGPERKRGKNPFRGEEIGGKLALLDSNTLLLTLGDMGFSGTESLQAFAQDPGAAYGKTIRIDVATGEAATFTLGHRNPQGLYVTREGQVWLTEHAAQGGDELNLLESGTNYGWPNVTYGTDYGSMIWPVSKAQGRHPGYPEPRFAWLPSIGVTQVIRMESDSTFPIWKGNLLVGSLSTRALYRLVTDGDRIVLSEPIPFGKRVRDLLELKDGRVLVWTDDSALVTIEPAKGNDGATLYATQCSGCHTIVDGLSHRLAPDLHGIVGRDIGAASGYDEYSAAMKSQQGQWTVERLDAFIRNPHQAVPGNSMAFVGVQDDRERAELIKYLKKQSSD